MEFHLLCSSIIYPDQIAKSELPQNSYKISDPCSSRRDKNDISIHLFLRDKIQEEEQLFLPLSLERMPKYTQIPPQSQENFPRQKRLFFLRFSLYSGQNGTQTILLQFVSNSAPKRHSDQSISQRIPNDSSLW